MDKIKKIIKKHDKYAKKYSPSLKILDVWSNFIYIPDFLDMILTIFDDFHALFEKYNMELIFEFIIIRLSFKMNGT